MFRHVQTANPSYLLMLRPLHTECVAKRKTKTQIFFQIWNSCVMYVHTESTAFFSSSKNILWRNEVDIKQWGFSFEMMQLLWAKNNYEYAKKSLKPIFVGWNIEINFTSPVCKSLNPNFLTKATLNTFFVNIFLFMSVKTIVFVPNYFLLRNCTNYIYW